MLVLANITSVSALEPTVVDSNLALYIPTLAKLQQLEPWQVWEDPNSVKLYQILADTEDEAQIIRNQLDASVQPSNIETTATQTAVDPNDATYISTIEELTRLQSWQVWQEESTGRLYKINSSTEDEAQIIRARLDAQAGQNIDTTSSESSESTTTESSEPATLNTDTTLPSDFPGAPPDAPDEPINEPTAQLLEQLTGTTQRAVTLSPSIRLPEGRTAAKYEWDFTSDGIYDFISTWQGATDYQYTESGTYTATFRITDDAGAQATAQMVVIIEEPINIQQTPAASPYNGQILTEGETANRAWYVDPVSLGRVYLGSPEGALTVLLSMSLGITNSNFTAIPLEGELRAGDRALTRRLAGRILLKVQDKGKAYYVHPQTLQAIKLFTIDDAKKLINLHSNKITTVQLQQLGLSDYNPLLKDNDMDTDGDGLTDAQEVQAGTPPFRSNPSQTPGTPNTPSTNVPNEPGYAPTNTVSEFVKGEVVIKFKSKTTANRIESALAKPNAEILLSGFLLGLTSRDTAVQIKIKKIDSIFKHVETQLKPGKTEEVLTEQIERKFSQRTRRSDDSTRPSKSTNLHKLTLDESANIEDIVGQLNKSPEVEYAEPNFVYKNFTIPNDPYYNSGGSWGQNYNDLWGLKKMQLEGAWDISEGQGRIVAVIDTGLDYNHDDIKSNIWTNAGEIANNGIDDDNNGFVDDVRGWDFTTCERFASGCVIIKPEDNNPMDGDGHGTHVSGTIAAISNNGIGIVGVAPQAHIMALKGLNDQGAGMSADLAAAIRYAADNGADIINMSWGGVGKSLVIEDALNYAASLGVVLVAAAGNSSLDVSPGFYPANHHSVIAVASTDENDKRSTFSNYGAKILVAAPGGGNTDQSANKAYRNILSLRSGTTDMYGDGHNVVGTNYYRSRGTSMASPHVAGVAALILSANPTLRSNQVAQIIQASADDVESPGPDLVTGSGRVNAFAALNIQSTPEISITSPEHESVEVRSNGLINVQGSAGGDNFSSYQLSYWSKNLFNWVPIGSPAIAPVKNGLLGSWNIKDIPVGPYLLRLAVVNTGGQVFSKIIKIEIENYFPEPISISPSFQIKPKISDDLIVWSDFPNLATHEALFVYDLTSGEQTQITNRSVGAQTPDVSGNRIVWRSASDIYVCTYDRSTKQCSIQQITFDQASQAEPAISGNIIAWQDKSSGNWDIHIRNLSKNENERLTFSSANQSNPDISGTILVWEEWGSGVIGSEVYLYDLSKKSLLQLTNHSAWQGNPAVSGNRIVWEDWRSGSPDIYSCVYDSTTGTCPEAKLVEGGVHRTSPDISGSRVVWREVKNNNEDIYVYDISKTNAVAEPVTANSNTQQLPAIDKNRVVWEDARNNTPPWAYWDIYMADLGPSATTTPPIIPKPKPKPIPVPDNIFSFSYPAGGEIFKINKTYNITWKTASTTIDLSKVRLSLYKEGGYKDFIAVDISNTGSYSWTVPNVAIGSDYQLRIFNRAYPNDFIDSNVFAIAQAEETTDPKPPSIPDTSKPDLSIQSLSINPKKEQYASSDAFSLNFVVKNIGTKTSGPFTLSVTNKSNNWDLGGAVFNGLAPGSSKSHSMSWSSLYWTQEGHNLVELKLDGNNEIDESNENNNAPTFGISVLSEETPTPAPPTSELEAILPQFLSGTTNKVITLSGAVKPLPAGTYLTKYEWDYESDGTWDYVSTRQGTVDYRYVTSGIYKATFRATDNRGNQSQASTMVYVSSNGATYNPPSSTSGTSTSSSSASPTTPTKQSAPTTNDTTTSPTPATSPTEDTTTPAAQTFDANLIKSLTRTTSTLATLSGAVSNLAPGTYMVKYEWDYTNDGVYDYESPAPGKTIPQSSVDYLYATAGTYTATFRATNNLGEQATASMTVNITE